MTDFYPKRLSDAPWDEQASHRLGAIAGNIVGTTGASMLFIRPWIRVNKYHYTGFSLPILLPVLLLVYWVTLRG